MTGTNFLGASPPGFFVSWQNYPKVAVAPLSALPSEVNEVSDLPEKWYGLSQEKIISFRESLLRSYKTMPVSLASDPNYELIDFQEIAMSSSLFELEVNLAEKPRAEVSFDSFSAPVGPSAKLDKVNLIENPKIPKELEYYSSDTDAKSNTALIDLFQKGFAVSSLAKVLSSGALGVKKNRKLVPTRWSITAVDSNISKFFIDEKLPQFKVLDTFKLFHSKYLDNDFWILLMPYPWSFEAIECWLPGGVWTQGATSFNVLSDFELNSGLKGYPEQTEGAYFAGRLAVTEYLFEKKLIFFALYLTTLIKESTKNKQRKHSSKGHGRFQKTLHHEITNHRARHKGDSSGTTDCAVSNCRAHGHSIRHTPARNVQFDRHPTEGGSGFSALREYRNPSPRGQSRTREAQPPQSGGLFGIDVTGGFFGMQAVSYGVGRSVMFESPGQSGRPTLQANAVRGPSPGPRPRSRSVSPSRGPGSSSMGGRGFVARGVPE